MWLVVVALAVLVVALYVTVVRMTGELREQRWLFDALEDRIADARDGMPRPEPAPSSLQPGQHLPSPDLGRIDSEWSLGLVEPEGGDEALWQGVAAACTTSEPHLGAFRLVPGGSEPPPPGVLRLAVANHHEWQTPLLVLLSGDGVIQGLGHVHDSADVLSFLEDGRHNGIFM